MFRALAVLALRWSIARSSAPTVSICSRVNSGRCAHTARHLRSRTRSASEKYGSSNSSPSDSSVPALSDSSAAVDHLLPAQLPVGATSPTAGAGETRTAQRRRANATDGSPDPPNGLSTSHEFDATGGCGFVEGRTRRAQAPPRRRRWPGAGCRRSAISVMPDRLRRPARTPSLRPCTRGRRPRRAKTSLRRPGDVPRDGLRYVLSGRGGPAVRRRDRARSGPG
jgi:hypothetical protein